MDENQAKAVVSALGGSTWQTGGNIWLVVFDKADGKVVALSDDAVCEYESRHTLETGSPSLTLSLR